MLKKSRILDEEDDDETGKIINKERSETGRVRPLIFGENVSGSKVTRLPKYPE